MAMPRSPIFPSVTPARNRIPAAGGAVWYPLHGGYDGLPDTPAMGQVGSGHVGSPWATTGFYTFPADNATAGLTAVHDEDDNLDAVMTLIGAAEDTTLYACIEASYVEQADVNGMLWFYGRASTAASYIGLNITSAEAPQFTARGIGASAGLTSTLTYGSGKTFAEFKAQGRFAAVLEIRSTATPSTVNLKLLLGKEGSGWTGVYTATAVDLMQNGATALPGRNAGANELVHHGLTLGARRDSADNTYTQFWGKGATNTGRIGNFAARKYSTYTAGKAEAVLASMIARPMDFPSELLD